MTCKTIFWIVVTIKNTVLNTIIKSIVQVFYSLPQYFHEPGMRWLHIAKRIRF